MKTNCLTRKQNSTSPALTDAFVELLKKNGRDENAIVVWDRTNRELERAGFKLNASSFGSRCFGTDTAGVGYSRDFYSSGEVASLVTNILVSLVDHSVNLPILKDHSIAGLSGGLKNMYGAIHNPNKYHDHNCDPFVAQVNSLKPIRDKHRLTVMDAVRIQYHGGPGYNGNYLAEYGGLIIAVDPVASDTIGLTVLEHFRKAGGLPPLEKEGRPVKYLKTAEKMGLGISDPNGIDLRVFRVDENGEATPTELV